MKISFNKWCILFIIALLLIVSLSGCNQELKYLFETEDEYVARIGEELAHAIETRDGEKIKSMLSVEALSNTTEEDLDAGLQYLFDTYKGTLMGKPESFVSYTSSQYGTSYNYKFMVADCILTTAENKYILYLSLYKNFDLNPDVVGIYTIYFHYFDKEMIYDKDYPGIYHPGWNSRPESEPLNIFMTKKYIDPYLQEHEKQKQTCEEKAEVD